MEHEFWHARWAEGRIGFHQAEFNAFLTEHWSALGLTSQAQVLVPLCGKSKDMLWLQAQGHDVLGVELSESACQAFFAEQGRTVSAEIQGDFTCYASEQIKLCCGDFFALDKAALAKVGAVYDRAALIALPPAMRKRYAELLCASLPEGVPVLLVTLEFEGDQGPPFNVTEAELGALFSARYQLTCLGQGMEGDRAEKVWLLQER